MQRAKLCASSATAVELAEVLSVRSGSRVGFRLFYRVFIRAAAETLREFRYVQLSVGRNSARVPLRYVRGRYGRPRLPSTIRNVHHQRTPLSAIAGELDSGLGDLR